MARTIELDVKFYFEVPDGVPGVPYPGVDNFTLSIEGPEVLIEMLGEDSIPVDARFTGWETFEVWDNTGDDSPDEPETDYEAIAATRWRGVLRDCDD